MFNEPLTPEQVHHNSLLLVSACREMRLNYDIQVQYSTVQYSTVQYSTVQ